MKPVFIILLAALFFSCQSELTADHVLDKSINFHDPDKKWASFKGELNVRMETPDRSDRNSKILIDLPNEAFSVSATRDSITIDYKINGTDCKVQFNGSDDFTEEEKKEHRLDCERAELYKNYYTYLYGLPMKLKDPGTILHENIEYRRFMGKDYVVLKASYDAEVGSDVWFFYLDPSSYALEVYQFFKTDENGKLNSESGEYILLSGIEEVEGIRMPKTRAWYYNKDDAYLGTDHLD